MTQIEPTKITNFNRSGAELESFWLFCIIVAGRNSDFAARCVGKALSNAHSKTPFSYFESLGETGIHNLLVANKVGQYTRITKAIVQSIGVNLRTCTLEDLLAIHGVGMKTARFFLLHSRAGLEYAVLDTHILAWMRDKSVEAPTSTPTNPEVYSKLEKTFIYLRKLYYPHLSPEKADLLIWAAQSGRLLDI